MKSEILYGIHPVYEALKANRRQIHEVYLVARKKSERLLRIQSLATSRGVAFKNIAAADIQDLAGTPAHQGVAARVSPYAVTSLAQLLQTASAKGPVPFVLVLDTIQDPQNLGAIIRTALCVGVDGVVIPKDRCASPTPAVSSASAGALEHIRLARVTNLVQGFKQIKRSGLWIAGLEKNAAASIYDTDLSLPLAVVLGAEQKGIRPLVRKNCDLLVSIPQCGPVDSLNVSAAAAVVLYEAVRQRGMTRIKDERRTSNVEHRSPNGGR